MRCECEVRTHATQLVVLTGGPSAGKTAVLEIVARHFCEHVHVLPEAATILFGGGFPRIAEDYGSRAAQRSIFAIQRNLERMAAESGKVAVALCDRGTLDGLAYWRSTPEDLFAEAGTSREAELARYAAVIHLRSPPEGGGYNLRNAVRVETPAQAAALDQKVLHCWDGHPNRIVIGNEVDFLTKAARAIDAIRRFVPTCCRTHRVPEVEPGAAPR